MGGGGKGKRKKTVVGYEYFMAAIFGLCMKADKILKIVYGDRVAWSGSAADQEITIDSFDLFGGNEVGGSGGLKGSFFISMGKKTQLPNWIMKKYLGEDVYAHRNIVTLSMDKSYVAAFSPQFRPLKCLVRHTTYYWNHQHSVISDSEINPIHEIRDVLINPDLGGQYQVADLDEPSFLAAAKILYDENFGLSPKWSESDQASSYIQGILDIIDGIKIKDRATGKIKIKLLRGGYDVDSLPIIGPSDFSAINSMTMVTLDSLVNRVTIKYTKITDVGEEASAITQENQANIDLQGGRINAIELDYSHITNAIPDLAARVLSRELRSRSYPLRSFTMTGKNALSQFEEGDLFILNFPERGIERLVCRILEADYGTLDSPIVTLTCTEDIFSADMTEISAVVPPTEWTDPFAESEPPTVYDLIELPYYLILNEGVLTPDELAESNQAIGYLMTLAQKPSVTDYGYYHEYNTVNGWAIAGQGVFSDSVILANELSITATAIPIATASLPLLKKDLAYIDGEFIEITSWSDTAIFVNRGMLDTLPKAHPANSRLWLPSASGGGIFDIASLSGATARCVLATFGPMGTSNPNTSTSVSLQMKGRQRRPYPPAYLRVNDLYFPEEFEGTATFSWRHRDRTLQQDILISQTAANIGPEDGTTYTLKLYDQNGVLRKSITDLTDNSYTWDTEAEDSNLSVITQAGITPSVYLENTTRTENMPSSVKEGQTILVWVMHTSALTTVPENYTLLESETCLEESNQYSLSLFSKTAESSDANTALTFVQESNGWLSVNINLWSFPSGLIIRGIAKVAQNNVTNRTILWPTVTAEYDYITSVVGGVSSYAHSGYTLWTTTSGEIISAVKQANNRMCIGMQSLRFGDILSGRYTFDDSAKKHGSAAIAILLGAPDGSYIQTLNNTIRVQLWSVRDGFTSWNSWDVTYKRKRPEGFGFDYDYNFGGN